MDRMYVGDIVNKEGEEVMLAGWVDARRDHGKIIFIDLRDRTGIAQLVFIPSNKEVYAKASTLRSEWVVSLKGTVNKRPSGMENKDIPTGLHELLVNELSILSRAEAMPIDTHTDGYEIGEEVRMKYRYLDLRRPRLQATMRMRSKVTNFIRAFLLQRDFIEIETPILGKSTPEGARDYLVPSRLQPGNFYALPQSPQQYKQLFMVAGMERYFQIARCFRDEDTRGDRQPEFTQLDLEMSFVDREEVMQLLEELMIEIAGQFPEKHITQVPFPRISYKDAIAEYGSDRPDIRKDKNDSNELGFAWVIDFPSFEKDEKTGALTYSHNPFTAPKQEFVDDLREGKNLLNIVSEQYDLVLNGFEIGGGGIRIHEASLLEKVFEVLGHSKQVIEERFGHMLQAFRLGAPPHGGIALGLDRIVALLQNEPNIREVIAFPKTGDGRDLMMEAPGEVSKEQLKELHITLKQS